MPMDRLGVPELLIVAFISCAWLVPIAVVVWAMRTLLQIRKAVADVEARIAEIERRLPKS
jgi:hypothetical protein